MMRISFEGQVAIVTGGAQGLGRAYSVELARRGAAVVVNDVAGADTPDASPAAELVDLIKTAGGKAVACHESVATPEGGQAIVDCAVTNFGTIDAVIHNAGVWRHKHYEEMTVDQLDPVLDVHLRGAFFVTQPAWAIMQAKRYGRIVLTSSSSGTFGREAGSNYAAAKAAMLGMGRALGLEGEKYGIRANCILPVAPFHRREPVPAELTEQLMKTGLAEDSGPELVAPMVAYLASARCAVNGEAFSAGGRRFARVFIGVADGWVSTAPDGASAEDVEAHLAEIEDLSSFAVPLNSWEELREIGRLYRAKSGNG